MDSILSEPTLQNSTDSFTTTGRDFPDFTELEPRKEKEKIEVVESPSEKSEEGYKECRDRLSQTYLIDVFA